VAHKAEHAVDLETAAIVGVTVQGADEGDTTTIQETLPEAAEQLEAVAAVTDDTVAVIEEVVAMPIDAGFAETAGNDSCADAGNCSSDRVRISTRRVGLRRAHVRRHENVLKRLLVHAGAFNLGLWMRTLFGVGTPRSLQGRLVTLGALRSGLWTLIDDAITATKAATWRSHAARPFAARIRRRVVDPVKITTCATGC
jgi:transposase